MEMRSVGAIFPGGISISIMGFLTEPLPATRLSGSRLSMAISGWLAVSQSSQWASEGVVHKGRGHQFLMPKELGGERGVIKETEHNRTGRLHLIHNMIHTHFSAIFDEKVFKPDGNTTTFFVNESNNSIILLNFRNYLSCFKVWLLIYDITKMHIAVQDKLQSIYFMIIFEHLYVSLSQLENRYNADYPQIFPLVCSNHKRFLHFSYCCESVVTLVNDL